MRSSGVKSTRSTLGSILSAIGNLAAVDFGLLVHGEAIKQGLYTNVYVGSSLISMYGKCAKPAAAKKVFDDLEVQNLVLWNAMLDMYAKSGNLHDARQQFELVKNKDNVSWNAIIVGYVQEENEIEAFNLFRRMNALEYIIPDEFSLASILSACAKVRGLDQGKQVHCLSMKTGLETGLYAGSSLIDMYVKCGNLDSAHRILASMPKWSVVSLNALIAGYAPSNLEQAILLLRTKNLNNVVVPDDVTFLGVLTACSHAGMVSEGRQIFNLMVNQYEIQPRIDHCACMVDLLGRWGFLEEAEEFISTFNLESDAKIWATMLGACRTHGDEGRGQRAAEKLIELEPQNSSPYVLLSNIHAASGNWDEVRSLRRSMKEKGVKKLPGCSWITVGQTTSFFVAGEISHSRAGDIGSALRDLMALMKDLCDIDSFYNVEDLSSG
ncbi:unnamed protein product [Linum tenue]|uniref:Pentatricopeptide repeat-containing protein n=1 Tax=Linum tenue TaxID=586396 RepID=A0AAV0QVR9_9ROSI|nr:unnamed protein product [Linum tenue]